MCRGRVSQPVREERGGAHFPRKWAGSPTILGCAWLLHYTAELAEAPLRPTREREREGEIRRETATSSS